MSICLNHATDLEIQGLFEGPLRGFALMEDRLAFLCHYFLDKPYLDGACGEGTEGKIDQNPLYRTDAFDCVTFVNLVLALIFSKDLQNFQSLLKKINYKEGKVGYENRHHFMSVDWNPANEQLGLIKPLTETIKDAEGKPIFQMTEAWIDRPNWFRHRTLEAIKLPNAKAQEKKAALDQLHQQAELMAGEKGKLSFCPLDKLFKEENADEFVLAQFPKAGVMEIVRPNWDLTRQIGTHLNISHVGFILQQSGQLYFYHASSTPQKVVVCLLKDYLKSFLKHPTIRGVAIWTI